MFLCFGWFPRVCEPYLELKVKRSNFWRAFQTRKREVNHTTSFSSSYALLFISISTRSKSEKIVTHPHLVTWPLTECWLCSGRRFLVRGGNCSDSAAVFWTCFEGLKGCVKRPNLDQINGNSIYFDHVFEFLKSISHELNAEVGKVKMLMSKSWRLELVCSFCFCFARRNFLDLGRGL